MPIIPAEVPSRSVCSSAHEESWMVIFEESAHDTKRFFPLYVSLEPVSAIERLPHMPRSQVRTLLQLSSHVDRHSNRNI